VAWEVDQQGHQVGVGLGGVGRLQSLVELLEVEPSLARRPAQVLGHLVALGVGDPQQHRVLVGTGIHGPQPRRAGRG